MKLKNIFNSYDKHSLKRKVISTALIAGVITSSTNSFAGTPSEDLRYETFNDSNVSITNILEDSNENLKIEGETLVNLAHEPSGWVYNNETIAFIRVNASTLKPNTDYTVLFYGNMGDIHNSATTLQNVTENNNLSIGESSLNKYKYKVRTNNMIHDGGEAPIYIIPHIYPKEGIVFTQDYLDNLDLKVMILEGDWTDRETPEYFEGMKSSFEDNLVTQEMVDSGLEDKSNLGKYKAEIKTTGKNIMPVNEFTGEASIVSETNHPDLAWMNEAIICNIPLDPTRLYRFSHTTDNDNWNNNLPNHVKLLLHNYPIKNVLPTYWNGHGEVYFSALEQNGKEIKADGLITGFNYISITTGGSFDYISHGIQPGELVKFYNMQLEAVESASSNSTSYEPYTESVKTFYLDSPLHKGDSIENINGTVYHIKRSVKTRFDGSENWLNMDARDTWDVAYASLTLDNIYANQNENTIVCDLIPSIKGNDYSYKHQQIYSWFKFGETPSIYIHLYKNKLETEDLSGFRKYLHNNPVNVVYQTENPEYKILDADLSIQLSKGNIHISHNSKIPTNLNIRVDRTANRAYEAIELAKTIPTVENLAQARMWINLLNDSTLKDDFQDEVSDITNLEDIQLEKKKVSANIDLYVKSENSLSMSLSTNSITFDNYTGTEDMEKLKAVEISINSSLPYDLNAYLETNFSNSDGSKNMDINTLKIKESSKSNYSSFTNLKEKVALKEDCASGNYIKHDIDLKLESDNAYQPDIYKTTVKFEAIQK